MNHTKWLITVLFLIITFSAMVVGVNFYVDHHAVRLSLFSGKKEFLETIYPDGTNQHMFNPERIFRNPEKFDSFLFGSSRTTVIDVAKIPTGRFYNMSYSLGLPASHLAILKAFLQRGVKIKSVVIGLDEFCFNQSGTKNQKHLVRIMHPDISGKSRLEIFDMYFFRKPDLVELAKWRDRVLEGKTEGRLIINNQGLNLGWLQKERIIEATGKPIFNFAIRKYEPITFGSKEMGDAFGAIEELIALSRTHHFAITFFITPFYSQYYLNNAEGLFSVKERLATLTGYYDFSGLNSVTTNDLNYYEESHYRYRVGDMIAKRIYGDGNIDIPNDFGVLVTRQNITRHLEKQKLELEQYLKARNLQ
jgi:hypothetical protein